MFEDKSLIFYRQLFNLEFSYTFFTVSSLQPDALKNTLSRASESWMQ